MAESEEINSHPNMRNDNTRMNVAGADLQAMIDNAAVTKAVDRMFKEPSGTHAKTQSVPHTKPPSKTHTSHKDESRHSSNQKSPPSKQTVLNQEPRSKTCSYKYFVSCKLRDFTGEKGAIDCMTWLDEMDTVVDISGCVEQDVVKFVSQSFTGEALAWWRSLVQATGKIPLYNLSWEQFVALIRENFCPQHEVEKIETDFLTLVMKNLDCQSYVTSFNTMSRLVPYLVTPEPKCIARFIGGLAPEIKGNVNTSRPTTYRSVVDLSLSLTLDAVRNKSVKTSEEGKRKREDESSHRSDKKRKGNFEHKKGCEFRNNSNQSDIRPKCKNCRKCHSGRCTIDPQAKLCGICKTKGHKTLECKELKNATCYNYIKYEVELADGTLETASTILDGCFIAIRNHSFPLSLLPMKLAGFDVVIGMDWLSLNQAQIACAKKQVIIKTPTGKSIIVQGDTHHGLSDQTAMLKASKGLKNGCVIYMAQVTVDTPKPKIEDIPVISEFTDVFPEELRSLPLDR
ncbi:uncharacterized protein LOC110925097 [Helianthus annuus]|uniref:uncharacterized protein LOC110925097 n=1 Tax=Helianthus annuus TaxID=4232 RepID=UPI000B901262|nr:uncharacterized protein LOC110925097 [Helianthus annuus]